MRKRGGRAALVSAAVAGALAIALIFAGALQRMRAQDMTFGRAMTSFLADTFCPGREPREMESEG